MARPQPHAQLPHAPPDCAGHRGALPASPPSCAQVPHSWMVPATSTTQVDAKPASLLPTRISCTGPAQHSPGGGPTLNTPPQTCSCLAAPRAPAAACTSDAQRGRMGRNRSAVKLGTGDSPDCRGVQLPTGAGLIQGGASCPGPGRRGSPGKQSLEGVSLAPKPSLTAAQSKQENHPGSSATCSRLGERAQRERDPMHDSLQPERSPSRQDADRSKLKTYLLNALHQSPLPQQSPGRSGHTPAARTVAPAETSTLPRPARAVRDTPVIKNKAPCKQRTPGPGVPTPASSQQPAMAQLCPCDETVLMAWAGPAARRGCAPLSPRRPELLLPLPDQPGTGLTCAC